MLVTKDSGGAECHQLEEAHQMETDLPVEDHHPDPVTLFGELMKMCLILEATEGILGEIHLEVTRLEDLPMVSNQKRKVQMTRRAKENGS